MSEEENVETSPTAGDNGAFWRRDVAGFKVFVYQQIASLKLGEGGVVCFECIMGSTIT